MANKAEKNWAYALKYWKGLRRAAPVLQAYKHVNSELTPERDLLIYAKRDTDACVQITKAKLLMDEPRDVLTVGMDMLASCIHRIEGRLH